MTTAPSKWKTLVQKNLPSNWEINMSKGTDAQCVLGLAHKSPVLNANPTLLKRATISTKGNVHTFTQGSEILTPQYKKFLDTMQEHPFPKVRKAFTKVRKETESASKDFAAGMHTTGTTEKYDYVFNLVIAAYEDEKSAKTMLENYRDSSEQGLDFKVPGVKIPGVSGTPSVTEVLSDPAVQEQMKKYVKPSELKKVEAEIKKVSAQAKKQMKEDSLKFSVQRYLGGNALHAKKKPIVYMMIQYGKYVLSGDFVQHITVQKPGSTPCDSLTKYKIKVTKTREGSEIFTDRELVPLKSTYKTEGYLHKQEMEDIVVKISKEFPI